MRFLSLVIVALVAGSASAGDCLRVAPVVQQQITGGCDSYSAAQVTAPAYTYAPTQALVVRPFVQAQAYGYQQQAIVVRQNVVQHQVVQPVVVRQNVVVQRQAFVQRQQVNNGAGVGAIGVLRVVGNTLGAIIGR